jgi:hypothetical protein
MSKFIKTKSIRLQNQTGANNNRITKQYNRDVIELNNTYSVITLNNDTQERTTISDTSAQQEQEQEQEQGKEVIIPLNNISIIGTPPTCGSSENNTFAMDDIYNTLVKVQGNNPIHNVVNKETINYGNKLDYLYKKQQFKKK